MAADTYQTVAYKQPAVYSRGPNPIVREYKVDFADLVGDAGGTIASDLLEAGDVIQFFKLPPDVKLLWARVDLEDIDSATSLTWDLRVTDGTTTKLFFDEATAGRSLGAVDTRAYSGGTGALSKFDTNSALGYITANDNFRVEFYCATAPAGAGSGDQIAVEIGYTSNLEQGEAVFRG